MSCRNLSLALIACGGAALILTWSASAQAGPTLDQQADAIYAAWTKANTPQNRALAKKRGAALEAKGFLPTFKRQRTLYSKLPSTPNFRFQDARGVAALAITDQGLAVRTFKGHKGMNYHWSNKPGMINVVKRENKVTTSRVKPLVPRFISRAFPKLSQKIGTFRARRMIRKAVRSGNAPSPRKVARALR